MLNMALEIRPQAERDEHLPERSLMQRLGVHDNAVAVKFFCLEFRVGIDF